MSHWPPDGRIFFSFSWCASFLALPSPQKSLSSYHRVHLFRMQWDISFWTALGITKRSTLFTDYKSNFKTASHCCLGRTCVQEQYVRNRMIRSLLTHILEESCRWYAVTPKLWDPYNWDPFSAYRHMLSCSRAKLVIKENYKTVIWGKQVSGFPFWSNICIFTVVQGEQDPAILRIK